MFLGILEDWAEPLATADAEESNDVQSTKRGREEEGTSTDNAEMESTRRQSILLFLHVRLRALELQICG